MKRFVPLLMLVAVSAVPAIAARQPQWKRSITTADRERLAGLWRAWTTARAQVFASGQGSAWLGLGALGDPGGLSGGAPPPPGRYACRTVKLGARGAGMPVMGMADTTPCRIEAAGDNLRFIREDGAQRTSGLLFPDGDRLVYLGALSLGSEPGLFRYNADVERNQVGVLRAIGPRRWRLELPWPRWESTLDIIEVVPAA